jgi:hypothetical protein
LVRVTLGLNTWGDPLICEYTIHPSSQPVKVLREIHQEFLSIKGIETHPGITLSVHHMHVFEYDWNGFLGSGRAQTLLNVDIPLDIFYFYEENHINSMTWAAGSP